MPFMGILKLVAVVAVVVAGILVLRHSTPAAKLARGRRRKCSRHGPSPEPCRAL